MHEVIIVGAGAAAAAVALELAGRGIKPLVLDVGHTNEAGVPRVEENLYAFRRRADSFDLHIGADLVGLRNVLTGEDGVAKLNAPNMAFITRDAGTLGPVEQAGFDAIQSFALGGLGNGWGAGLYRFVDADLAGFPYSTAELAPYFDRLTREIGISGAEDDLMPFFGAASGLLPPLKLSHNAGRILEGYRAKRERLTGRQLRIGHPRVGALSQPLDGRPACDYSNLEFWQEQPYFYTPAITFRKLIGAGRIEYRPGVLVSSWTETGEGVTVTATDLATGTPVTFDGKTLILAAGAINSAKLALKSFGDHTARLPLLENPALQVPFVLPASVGRRLDTHAFGLVQLNLVWESPAYSRYLQGSFIELTAPMRAEFFGRFPLSARANLALMRTMLPAMILLQLYFPAESQPPATIQLREDGRLRIEGQPHRIDLAGLRDLLGMLRALGLWTHGMLIQQPITGHAIHYAGTLPMSRTPGPYQCDESGRLHGTRRVFVADSASFASLTAKNMSLGMMAHAMRVSSQALASG
jgi:choline dehydrogenase-like flavoprotein